jgi:hypothetical protein
LNRIKEIATMPEIILSEEQTRIFASAIQPVQVCDAKGRLLGTLAPVWTEEDIAEAKRVLASNAPWSTTEQVLARLHALEKQ